MGLRGPAYDPLKRGIDLAVSIVGLVVLAPLLAVLAWRVRRELGPPVLFAQRRPGRHGEAFTVRKFRTMTDARGADGRLLPDDARLTPFGTWLRSSSLDELPEIVNVLVGEMSLVGPRPLLLEYLDLYTPEQARRHEVRPGITGWAQVNGRNDMGWDTKLAMDVWYVDHRSLWLDVRILLRTLWVAIRREGISLSGHATTVRFRGSVLEPPREVAGAEPDAIRHDPGPVRYRLPADPRSAGPSRPQSGGGAVGWGPGTEEQGPVRAPDGAILCPCGDRLADRIDGDTVVIDGAELEFRRRNDRIVCRSCGVSQAVRPFRTTSGPGDTGLRRRRDD